jgi:protein-tyrosine kinase
MERIKYAIEKAKSQEPVGIDQFHQLNSDGQIAKNSQLSSQNHDELANISYQHTRVIKLSAEHLKRNRIVAFDKSDPKSIAFDVLRTKVLQKMDENGWRTLAITSPTPESGKTIVSINLAISIAQQTNKSSMLVDFDLRRPKVGNYMGLQMDKSLNDLLDGDAALTEVLINPDIPRLVILPTKKPVKKSSETLSSKTISDLVKELGKRYESRIVIFDLPPILGIDDTLAILPQVDCVLLVLANGMSTKQEIETSLRYIPAEKLVGTILNKAEIKPSSYYY